MDTKQAQEMMRKLVAQLEERNAHTEGRFYEMAYRNLTSSDRDRNLWSMCLAKNEMDEKKAAAAYINEMALRYEQEQEKLLIEEEVSKLRESREREEMLEEIVEEIEEEKKKPKEDLRFIKPIWGFVFFIIAGFGTSNDLGYGWFLTSLNIISSSVLGVTLFFLVRFAFVESYRRETSDLPVVAIFIVMILSAISTYFLWKL